MCIRISRYRRSQSSRRPTVSPGGGSARPRRSQVQDAPAVAVGMDGAGDADLAAAARMMRPVSPGWPPELA